MKIINKILLILPLFVILTLLSKTLLADYASAQNEIYYQKTNPGSPFYSLKRASEKTLVFFYSKYSKDKENAFTLKLLDRRIAEYIYIADKNDLTNFEKTAIRYNTTVGSLIDNKVKLGNREKEILRTDIAYLGKIRDKYEYASAYWLLTQQAIEISNQLISI